MYRAQQYTGVATLCLDALEVDPDNLELRVLRTRALLALRRDEEAKRELSRILRVGSETAEVFRLLGELAIRRGKLVAAETFLRHALRLSPGDRTTEALLDLVQSSNQPTVAVEKLPAATATVGCTLLPPVPRNTDGQNLPGDPGATGEVEAPDVIAEYDADSSYDRDAASSYDSYDSYADDDVPARPHRLALGTDYTPPLPHAIASAQPDPVSADIFGRYLVAIGALTAVQLHAALDYHRRAGISVGAAAIALGFASAPSVEGAVHAFHQTRYSAW
ncbi:MAG TPA: tetratricopeptide repeat protein [Kofleriaceae bacterium]|nr:tetratricopeptide repeat protein [Kofleriaceae bacterium]